ncbi:MAG TPA: Asd/ArgC dimerization domain-containing protein [Myxococcota bacterium]|nr:Asd/ArgC dimerization domain-containing protein [Myxococcota bacterium]
MAAANLRVALLGATGAVGAEILQVLEERRFPMRELRAYASAESEGQELEYRGESVKLRRLRAEEVAACDLVICAARSALVELLPVLRRSRAVVIDVSGTLEADPAVPLFLPGVTPALERSTRPSFVAIPRGVAAGLGLALAPFARASLLRRVTAVTLESASGAGIAGVGELTDHTVQVLNRMSGERSESEVFAQSLAFDCLPQIGALEPSGDTTDELALARVLKRLLPASDLALELTRVRIPTLGGSLASVHVELANSLALSGVRELLEAEPSITLLPETELPTPRAALGHDDVAVGRLRASGSRVAFVLALNDLRLGAALGVVGAAEALLA